MNISDSNILGGQSKDKTINNVIPSGLRLIFHFITIILTSLRDLAYTNNPEGMVLL